jgi:hypothetical protein
MGTSGCKYIQHKVLAVACCGICKLRSGIDAAINVNSYPSVGPVAVKIVMTVGQITTKA